MATSGTTAFDMDFTEIAEEAWERAGREMRSGYDLRTARRSMNLMTIEWQNRGINMWTIDEGTVTLVKGTSQYNLPTNTVDLLEQVVLFLTAMITYSSITVCVVQKTQGRAQKQRTCRLGSCRASQLVWRIIQL